jgi:hypothetical protein
VDHPARRLSLDRLLCIVSLRHEHLWSLGSHSASLGAALPWFFFPFCTTPFPLRALFNLPELLSFLVFLGAHEALQELWHGTSYVSARAATSIFPKHCRRFCHWEAADGWRVDSNPHSHEWTDSRFKRYLQCVIARCAVALADCKMRGRDVKRTCPCRTEC